MEATPVDVIDRAMVAGDRAAKRARADEDEEAEVLETPELPLEIQLQIVEAVEAGQRGAVPEPASAVVRAAQTWRDAYDAWKLGRAAQMENPPSVISLARARLFVSPRFKLISEMPWAAVRQILNAYSVTPGPRKETGPYVLAFVNLRNDDPADRPRWTMFLLNEYRSEDEIVLASGFEMRQLAPAFGTPVRFEWNRGVGLMFSAGERTRVADIRDHRSIDEAREILESSSRAQATTGATLIYGRIFNVIPLDTLGMRSVLRSLANAFFDPAMKTNAPPSDGMLSWRKKIVVLQVNEIRNRSVMDFYVSFGSVDGLPVFSVSSRDTAIARTFTIEQVTATTIDLMRKAIDRAGRFFVHATWSNGSIVGIYDSHEGYLVDRRAIALDVLPQMLAIEGEPALRPLDRPEWGYEMTMHVRESPYLGRSGLMIMPAPWFFYLAEKAEPGKLEFAFGTVEYRERFVAMFALESSHVQAYQRPELLFLSDEMDSDEIRELSNLTMLQRRDIPERATAHLDVEPL